MALCLAVDEVTLELEVVLQEDVHVLRHSHNVAVDVDVRAPVVPDNDAIFLVVLAVEVMMMLVVVLLLLVMVLVVVLLGAVW